MAVSLLPSEGKDGCSSEAEVWPPHHHKSTVEQFPPPHVDVGLCISIHVLLSEQSHDGVQIEFELHITKTDSTRDVETKRSLSVLTPS